MLGDRQVALGSYEQSARGPDGVLDPEHLSDGDGLVERFIVEHAEDHAQCRVVAQRDRLRRTADLVAFGLVVAQHVGAQRTFLGFGAGRLVVGDSVGGHQQGGDGVDDGGLARPDVAGEQGVVAAEIQAPDVLIEGAPIEQLEPVEAEPGDGVVGREFEHGCLDGHNASLSSRVCWSASPMSRSSESRYCCNRWSKSDSHCASTNALMIRRTS